MRLTLPPATALLELAPELGRRITEKVQQASSIRGRVGKKSNQIMANSNGKTMKMNPQSASTLVWAAAAATIVGFMVMSPGGQFISYIFAVLLALPVTLFGSKMSRVVGGVFLVISLLLAFQVYPAFKSEGDGFRKRVEDRSGKSPTQMPGQ